MKIKILVLGILFSIHAYAGSKIFPMDSKVSVVADEVKEVTVQIYGEEAETAFNKLEAKLEVDIFEGGTNDEWYTTRKKFDIPELGIKVDALKVWDNENVDGVYRVSIKFKVKQGKYNSDMFKMRYLLNSDGELNLRGIDTIDTERGIHNCSLYNISCREGLCEIKFLSSSEANKRARKQFSELERRSMRLR